MSDTLPPGVLPNITDTDPPPLHPDTIVDDGRVGAKPTCEDIPHVTFDGTTLACTQGNWTGSPTSYAYQWQLDGEDVVGADESTYDASDDAGKTATCIVTAANGFGSTTAPPSNEVAIGTSSRRARQEHQERRHPQQDHDERAHERNHRTAR